MQYTKKNHFLLLLFPALLLCLGLSGCDSPKSDSHPIARVNDRLVTADEFAFFYELVPRHITRQEKAKARMDALARLTDRILLAQQAESLGLGRSDTLMQHAVDLYRRQAVNRELYLKYIRNPISVSEQEERDAFDRSTKILHVKHFKSALEPEIVNVRTGVVPWHHIPLYPGVNTIDSPLYGLADAVSWNDVSSDLEDLLYSLDLHQVSEPVFDGTYYHIFKVVDYENNIIVRENDFHANRESMNGILRKRKEAVAAAVFVQNVMEPQNLIIRADALNALTDHLWEKRPAENDERLQYLPDTEVNTFPNDENQLSSLLMATFESGNMTIDDFLMYYRVNPQPVNYNTKTALRESLKNSTAVYVRDYVLSEKGLRENLDQKPSVKEEVQTRKETLLAEKMIKNLYRDVPDSLQTKEAREAFLENHLTELRAKAAIEIDEDALLSINTSDEGLSRKIDFIVVPSH